MPRSLEHGPRISTNGARAVSGNAPTLAAGAATDAGVVRGATQSRARSRLLVLLAIVLVVPPLVFVGFRAAFKKETPTALVPAEPVVSAAAGTAQASSLTTALIASPPPTVTAPVETAPVAATSVATARVGGRGRPRLPPSAALAPPPSSTPSLTSTAAPPPTTPRPATSGHDIF